MTTIYLLAGLFGPIEGMVSLHNIYTEYTAQADNETYDQIHVCNPTICPPYSLKPQESTSSFRGSDLLIVSSFALALPLPGRTLFHRETNSANTPSG